jgi:hypothetical protein
MPPSSFHNTTQLVMTQVASMRLVGGGSGLVFDSQVRSYAPSATGITTMAIARVT